jgi:hypothetical protein
MRRLCTREKYLKIKEDAYELSCDTSALLLKKSKSLRKRLVDLSFSTGAIKETDRGEKEFRAPGKKSGKKLGIFSRPDSSIISLISNSKMF